MHMLAIIADDLTGTLDSAAPFAGRGLHTEVVLQPEAIADALAENPAVLSISTGTRDMPLEEARKVTVTILSSLPSGTALFKKVDSRLKGNIAAELDVTPFRSALVAPAIPDFGRVVRSGCVEGFGVDLPIAVVDRLGRHAAHCSIPDTCSQQEMQAALRAAQADGCDLLIGARGLADALAQQMTGRADGQPAVLPEGAALFVIGSRDPITLSQVDELGHSRQVHYNAAPNGELTPPIHCTAPLTLVQAIPGTVPAAPAEVSARLAEGVHPQLTRSAKILLLSGGATAEAVLRTMSISRLRLVGECLPGLGLAFSQGHCIIAKSGGFGQRDTLKKLADMILGEVD